MAFFGYSQRTLFQFECCDSTCMDTIHDIDILTNAGPYMIKNSDNLCRRIVYSSVKTRFLKTHVDCPDSILSIGSSSLASPTRQSDPWAYRPQEMSKVWVRERLDSTRLCSQEMF